MILIVDDEAEVRRVLRLYFERHGYEVVEAGNGHEAVGLLRREAVDLVVTDVVMPDMDGLETLCHVRRHYPDIPVIAISAPSNELFLESARGLGAAHTFEKPLCLRDVVGAVEETLRAQTSGGGEANGG